MKIKTDTLKRVALYARVSTIDKGQNPETQLAQLRQYARNQNFKVIGAIAEGLDPLSPNYINHLQVFL